MANGSERDPLIGVSGNATVSMPIKVTNKAGQTDPGQRDSGHNLPLKKVVKKGWCKQKIKNFELRMEEQK